MSIDTSEWGSPPVRSAPTAVEVIPFDGLNDREVKIFAIDDRDLALVRLGGEVFALSGTCSYHPIDLSGATIEDDVLTCPWYGAQFDVRAGESVFLRSVRPLATYPTAIRDGQVVVYLPAHAA